MEQDRKIYTVGDAHLDTSWVWTFETTVEEYIPKTLKENFSLFEKYPEYKFNFEGSYRYELMKEYYPEDYERLKGYIKEGRWNTCGSCYENGDVNIPSPESLIRNVIYGNGYFRDEFGTESNDIFLPDCFGFGKALPGIAAHCGIKGFSTQKLSWGCCVPVPFDVGKWTSIDGKFLWCALMTGNYTSVLKKVRDDKRINEKLERNYQKYGFNSTMEYHGVGDRGGAPKEESVKTVVKELRDNPTSRIKVLSSTTQEFFDDMEALPEEIKNKLPVHEGEFLMTEHGAGSYTTRTASKRFNRRCELLADAAERTAVSSFILGLSDYPQNVLDTAWKRTIAHQFHDDITGTSWMIDYKRNWNDYVQSLNSFSTEYTAGVRAITGKMDTSFAKGIAVAVSNNVQSSKTVKQAVSTEVDGEFLPEYVRVFDRKGKEVPSQLLALKNGKKKVTFIAEIPSNGIAVYDVQPSSAPYKEDTGLTLDGKTIENKRYILKIDINGDISSLFDKKLDKELLKAPVRLQLLNDVQIYHYSAWEVKYKDIMSKPYAYAEKPMCIVVDNGPALCTLEIVRTVGKSSVKQFISLDAESDFVNVYNELDWRSESSNLKVSFPFSAKNDNASYDIGLGCYQRPTNTKECFEVPAQRWADITDEEENYGVAVLSDSRFGWDKPNKNTLRLTAVHSATNSFKCQCCQHIADFGINRFSFGIFGHEGKPDSVPAAADLFCQPMHTFIVDKHSGEAEASYSLCSVDSDTVRILGIKKAQKSDDIVIRLVEYTGEKQKKVFINFALPISSAKEITGDEQVLGDVSVENGKLVLDFEPHQIRSLMLKFDGVKAYEKKNGVIDLPFDTEASSYNGDEKKDKLAGYSIPAELIPESITEGGIEYSLKKDGVNALTCRGQVIAVPENAKSVHFLATSVSGDRFAIFSVDGEEKEVVIQNCFEAVGAWDLIGLGETGYIKKNPQYLTFTHTHSAKGDEIAKQFYVFHTEINCEGCKEIKLPDDDRIVIFAASYDENGNSAVPTDEHFDSLEKRENDYVLSKYAKKYLYETPFETKMNRLKERVEYANTNNFFTPERRDKLAERINDHKSNKSERIKKRRAFRVKLGRKLGKNI